MKKYSVVLWKTVLLVSSKVFSLSTPTFSLSTPALWKTVRLHGKKLQNTINGILNGLQYDRDHFNINMYLDCVEQVWIFSF